VPIVSSSGISSYHNQWKVKGPGVVIGRKGTLGTVHFIPSNFWPHDTTLWVKDFKGNNPKLLNYFLQSLKLQNFDVGASNPTLNRNHLHKINIVFPRKVDKRSGIPHDQVQWGWTCGFIPCRTGGSMSEGQLQISTRRRSA
jgi:hypothetical protein